MSIRPFNDHDLTANPAQAARRKRWNRNLSSIRISVEHAFGRLKGRFPILRALPGQNLSTMHRLIEALLVVHNILETIGDDPTTIVGFDGAEDEAVMAVHARRQANNEAELEGDDMYRTGLYRRKCLVDLMEQRML